MADAPGFLERRGMVMELLTNGRTPNQTQTTQKK